MAFCGVPNFEANSCLSYRKCLWKNYRPRSYGKFQTAWFDPPWPCPRARIVGPRHRAAPLRSAGKGAAGITQDGPRRCLRGRSHSTCCRGCSRSSCRSWACGTPRPSRGQPPRAFSGRSARSGHRCSATTRFVRCAHRPGLRSARSLSRFDQPSFTTTTVH